MATKVVKRGQKQCPKCGTVCGVRSFQCPNDKCNHKFVKGEKSPAKVAKPRKARKTVEPAVASGSTLISTLGLIANLKALAADLGGVEKATALIDRVDALVDQAGGVEALKESLQIVAGVPVVVIPVAETVPAIAPAKKGGKRTAAPAAPAAEAASGPKAEALAAEEAAPGESRVA